MLHLELSNEEEKMLREVLADMLPRLDVEIHRTDRLEFKVALTHRAQVLRQLLKKLAEAPAPIL